jgi:hypothetical protein
MFLAELFCSFKMKSQSEHKIVTKLSTPNTSQGCLACSDGRNTRINKRSRRCEAFGVGFEKEEAFEKPKGFEREADG